MDEKRARNRNTEETYEMSTTISTNTQEDHDNGRQQQQVQKERRQRTQMERRQQTQIERQQ